MQGFRQKLRWITDVDRYYSRLSCAKRAGFAKRFQMGIADLLAAVPMDVAGGLLLRLDEASLGEKRLTSQVAPSPVVRRNDQRVHGTASRTMAMPLWLPEAEAALAQVEGR
jgi:hypothetical protein